MHGDVCYCWFTVRETNVFRWEPALKSLPVGLVRERESCIKSEMKGMFFTPCWRWLNHVIWRCRTKMNEKSIFMKILLVSIPWNIQWRSLTDIFIYICPTYDTLVKLLFPILEIRPDWSPRNWGHLLRFRSVLFGNRF